MRGERRFYRGEGEREESDQASERRPENQSYEKKIRDKIEEDPAEKHRSGFDPVDDGDRATGDDDAWDPNAGQRECNEILEEERSKESQKEIDDIVREMDRDGSDKELDDERERRAREEADD